MAFDIIIQGGFFVVNNTSTTEHIRRPRSVVRFNVDSSSVYRFYLIEPVRDGSGDPFILGNEVNKFAFGDLGTVTEDGVGITIGSAAALTTYLSGKISFFFSSSSTADAGINVQISGRNPNVGLAFEDIWGGGDLSTLDYDTQTGNFTPGTVIEGGTSGATATIVIDDDNGTDGTLTLRKISGVFANNETISDSGTGSADVDGTISKILFRDDATGGSGEQWEVICESALDTSAGTGARTITTTYLDDDFEPQVEVVNLNGQTAQLFVATDSYRHKQTFVATYGALPNGVYGKTNNGVIVIRDTVTKKIRTVIGYDDKITDDEHGLNSSLDMFYTVPLGKVAEPVQVNINTTKNNNATARALVRVDGAEGWLTLTENAVYQNTFTDDLSVAPATIPAGADIKLIARSDNEGTMLNIELFIIEKNA